MKKYIKWKQLTMILMMGCCFFILIGCESDSKSKETPLKVEQVKKESSIKKVNTKIKTDITITYLSEERPSFTKRVKMRADSANRFLYSFLTGQRAKQSELPKPFAKIEITEKAKKSSIDSETYFITKKKGDYYIYEKNKLDALKLVSKKELEKLQKFVGNKDLDNGK